MKSKNIIKITSSGFLLLVPAVTFAAFEGLADLLKDFSGLVQDTVVVVFGLAMLFFMWNMSQVVLKAGDAKAKEEHRQKMIWGIIAMFVMFSIWGILKWIGLNLNIEVGSVGN